MSIASFVRFNPSYFLFVDPSINTMGISIYLCKSKDGKTLDHKLFKSECKRGNPDTSETTAIRCRDMYRHVAALVSELSIKKVYIETPPDTIYEQSRLDKNQIIARAQSVAKLNAITYSIFGHMVDKAQCFPILPAQWQVKKSQGGVKEWSLHYANLILSKHGFDRQLRENHKIDQNEADAITMGDVILRKLASKG